MFSTEWFQTVIKGFFNLETFLSQSEMILMHAFKTFYHVKMHSAHSADSTPPIFHPGLRLSNSWWFLLKRSHWETRWLCIWGLAAFREVLRFTHTHCTPRNETQRWCSMCVNIDCVSSGLYCALPHLGFVSLMFLIYSMEVLGFVI